MPEQSDSLLLAPAAFTLDDILITAELSSRPPRPPDFQAENRALHAIGLHLADESQAILRELVAVALDLCRAGTAGLSLLEATPAGEAVFRWVALSGAYAPYEGGTTPAAFSPCGTCLERQAPQLYARPARHFTYFDGIEPPIVEALVIPLPGDGRPQGTIWIVAHDESRKFDAEDVRVMTGLAAFTAAALRAASAREAAEAAAQCEQSDRATAEAEVERGRRTTEALRASEQRLSLALDAAGMGTWDWDLLTGRVVWSRHHERLFGYGPGEAADTLEAFRRRIHPDDLPATERRIRQSLETQEEYRDEYRVVWPDGSIHWIQGAGRFDADGTGRPVRMRGVVVETTDRRQAEEALHEQARQLTEADRHKDAFLAQLAHELRTPLGSLLNGLRLLHLQGGDPAVRRQALDLAMRQVHQLTRLIEGLLDLARVRQGKMDLQKAAVDLNACVARAVEAARPFIDGRGHDLEVALPLGPVPLEADPSRLEQVVVNLLHNAAKYTEVGGRICLVVERGQGEAVVRVRDTGIGLAPEMLRRVFQLYAQVEGARDHAQGGLGIGLSLVAGLVELHGGSVQAYSDGLGYGSEFVVRLPALPDASAAPPEVWVETAPAPARRLRVLVVDDSLDGSESLATLLRLWGHHTEVVHDGESALAAARAAPPDVVLLDIGLPGMDGHEVARRLRWQEGLGQVRLVAVTGYGRAEDYELSRESGFDDHLLKPVDLDALREMLARFGTERMGRVEGSDRTTGK